MMNKTEKYFEQTVLVVEAEQDQIELEGINFDASTTIGLHKTRDFHLKIELNHLSFEEQKELVRIYKQQKDIAFKSKIVSREKYPIERIILEDMTATQESMTFWCVSDNPDLYTLIIPPK